MERIALQRYAGHEIDLVIEHAGAGRTPRTWFEVRDPATGALRGRFATRGEAERHLAAVFPGVPPELGRVPAVPRRRSEGPEHRANGADHRVMHAKRR